MAAGQLETGKALAFHSMRDHSQDENKITIGPSTRGEWEKPLWEVQRRLKPHNRGVSHVMTTRMGMECMTLAAWIRAERAGLPWHWTRCWSIGALGQVGASEHEDGSARSPGIQVAARTH